MLVTIFADASYDHRLLVGGWGGWARSDRGKTEDMGRFQSRVNSIVDAEIMAALNAVHMAFKQGIACEEDRLLIQLDNQTALELLDRDREPSSIDSEMAILRFDALIEKYRFTYRTKHVKAHVNPDCVDEDPRRFHVNHRVDHLAKLGLAYARKFLNDGGYCD